MSCKNFKCFSRLLDFFSDKVGAFEYNIRSWMGIVDG